MTARRLDHTAIAVHDLEEAIDRFSLLLGAPSVERAMVPDQGVEVAFLTVGGTTVELISPRGDTGGVARFLAARGEALHHICLAVDDIEDELARLQAEGIELIDTAPRRGVHGRVAFVHPRGTGGILLELLELHRPE